MQAVLLGLALHDVDHPGATFYADTADGPPGGRDVTVEWNSSAVADEFARAIGCSLHQRLVIAYVIWSSTFGAGTPEGLRLGLGRIRPKGFVGRLMRAVDVLPSADVAAGLRSDVAITWGRLRRSRARPPSRSGARLATGLAALSLTHRLGWRDRLAVQNQGLASLGDTPVSEATLLAELEHHGVALA